MGAFGLPGRHEPCGHRIVNVVEIRLRAVVVDERERPDAAGMVAGRAVLVENRRDVFSERWLGAAGGERLRLTDERDANQRHGDAGDLKDARPDGAAVRALEWAHWGGGAR